MAPTNEVRKFFEVSVHQDDIKAFSTALHLLQKVGKEMTVGKFLLFQALETAKLEHKLFLYRNRADFVHFARAQRHEVYLCSGGVRG